MNTEFTNLSEFFARVKSISFWQRVFGWNAVRTLSYEAYKEFSTLFDLSRKNNAELVEEKNRGKLLEEKIQLLQKADLEKQEQLSKKDSDIKELNRTVTALNSTVTSLTRENTEFRQTEKSRLRSAVRVTRNPLTTTTLIPHYHCRVRARSNPVANGRKSCQSPGESSVPDPYNHNEDHTQQS